MSLLCRWFGVGCPAPAPVPVPPTPPPAPAFKPVAIIVFNGTSPVVNASVSLVGSGVAFPLTNTDGYSFENVPGTVNSSAVMVTASGFLPYVAPLVVPTSGGNLYVGGPDHPGQIQLPALVPSTPPLPPVPSREEVCHGQLTAQAIIIHSLVYGDMPWWPACWAWLTPADRAHIAPQLLALGDTIMLIDTPSGTPLYDEGGQFYSPDKFPALPFDPVALKSLVAETLGLGFKACWVFLGGDVDYNLAVAQVQALAPALGNLNSYVAYVPGWDGVWHAPGGVYTQDQVKSFAALARAAGALYVGLEHGTGYLPVGEGGTDFLPGGHCVDYDFFLGEFNSGQFDDSVWQILGRMVRPYNRPPQQPAGDDQNPPFYLSASSARGPYYYHVFEWAMYVAVRGEDLGTMAAWKAQFAAMAPGTRIC